MFLILLMFLILDVCGKFRLEKIIYNVCFHRNLTSLKSTSLFLRELKVLFTLTRYVLFLLTHPSLVVYLTTGEFVLHFFYFHIHLNVLKLILLHLRNARQDFFKWLTRVGTDNIKYNPTELNSH